MGKVGTGERDTGVKRAEGLVYLFLGGGGRGTLFSGH